MERRLILAITGALGFIGHHLVDAAVAAGHRCWLVDAETYAADLSHLERWDDRLIHYTKGDITTLTHLPDVDAVINLAAETHVDSSIVDSRHFVWTNIVGVHNLLELIRAKRTYELPLMVQISTDEVYGSVADGDTLETAPLNPSSPYAASKAAADLLVQSYATTHDVPYNIIRPSNCYGTGQFPEKLIPKAIRYFTQGKLMPIHDSGEHIRSWLNVHDCAQAILTVLTCGAPNTIYNVGGNTQASITQVVKAIGACFELPAVQYAYRRAGVDHRYCVNDATLRALGWTPQGNFFEELPHVVATERTAWRW